MPHLLPSGRNMHAELSSIAREIGDRAIGMEAVEGVVFLGSLARGFMDESSDLDISIIVGGKDLKRLRRVFEPMAKEVESNRGVEADIEVHAYDDFARRQWGEIERFSFQHCQIYFDRNGRLGRSIKEKLDVPRDFWTRRIVEGCIYLSGYASPGREGRSTAENWVRRGDLAQAHYCAGYVAELIMELTYALNREFLPPPKWRMFNLRNLPWRPEGLEESLATIMSVGEMNQEGLARRLSAARELWPRIIQRVEEVEDMDMDSMNIFYNERIVYGD